MPPMSIDVAIAPTPSVFSYFTNDENQLQEQMLEHYFGKIIQRFLGDSKVHNATPDAKVVNEQFSDHKVPLFSGDYHTYFHHMAEDVLIETTHVGSPLMIGHMTSALPFFLRPLSKLVTAINQNTVKLETSSMVTYLERETVSKIHHELYKKDDVFYKTYVHDPNSALGCITSGGTLANLTGLWVARNRCLGPKGTFRGVEAEGLHRALKLYGYDDAVIIGSQLMHYSFKKAADMLGIGTSGLITIPYDNNYQIRPDLLEEKIIEFQQNNVVILALIGVAGATETGTVDDLVQLGKIASKYNIHFHVDAAWGGPMIFSKKHQKQLAGIETADSITIDGHKQLYTPMGCGMVLFNDPYSALSIRKTANYIIRNDSLDAGKFSAEGSRPASVIFLHACLTILGREGYEALIDRNCETTMLMAKRINESEDFELIVPPNSNILLYRWIPPHLRVRWENDQLSFEDNQEINQANLELQALIAKKGESFVSRTTIFCTKYQMMTVVLRVVIANPNTSLSHIDFALEEQRKLVRHHNNL